MKICQKKTGKKLLNTLLSIVKVHCVATKTLVTKKSMVTKNVGNQNFSNEKICGH
jgi:hypothetical protein